jgi:hypothetical protein
MEYVRGIGKPLGVLVAFLTDAGDIRIGWSKRHAGNEPIPFSKKIAKRVAICRALTEPILRAEDGILVTRYFAPIPHRIAREIPSFAERAKKYFKKDKVLNFLETEGTYEENVKKRTAGFV